MQAAIVEREEQTGAVVAHPASDTDALLAIIERVASDPEADPERVERFMALYEKAAARKALLAFNAAMSAAQNAMPAVVRDAENKQTSSRYARLETISDAIDPVIHGNGFSISYGTFVSTLPGHYGVRAEVAHIGGHIKTFDADVPADTVGPKGNQNKTPTHGFGSTMSYGRRYLKLMIFDVKLKGEDKDGNKPGDVLTEEQVEEINGLIDEAVASRPGTDRAAWLTDFLAFMGASGLLEIRAKDFDKATTAIRGAIKKGSGK